jgi:hypothetical protein
VRSVLTARAWGCLTSGEVVAHSGGKVDAHIHSVVM